MFRLFIGLGLLSGMLFGCATTSTPVNQNEQINQWVEAAIQYEQSLPLDHPDHYQSIVQITPKMKRLAREQTYGVQRNRRARAIAHWLIGADGHAMRYDINANLSPIQAFEQGVGNCLSFTILLINLAHELGISLDYNEVDIPDSWGSEGDNRLVFYRHVNAVSKTAHETQIFDLAIENYDARYPQRKLDKRKAIALLHNNRAMQALQNNDLKLSKHYLKLAIALNPESADLFTNLGSLYKRANKLKLAESFFLAALTIEPTHMVANSNLERLYRSQQQNRKADTYAKLAQKSLSKNPYYLYKQAEQQNKMKEYKLARRSINRAKKLHDNDSRFFELSSRINQSLGNYKYAVKELIRAHQLAINETDRHHYFNKATLVAKKWVAQKESRQRPIQSQYDSGLFQRAR